MVLYLVPESKPNFQKQIRATIQPAAKTKQDPATVPRAVLDHRGYKKSYSTLGTMAARDSGSKTSGFLTPAIQN